MSWGCDVAWLITGGIGAVIGAIDGVDAWLSGGSTRDVALGALQGGAIGFVIGATLGYGMPLLSCAGQAAVNAGMLGFGAATTLLGVGDAIQQGNTGLAAWRAGFGLTMLGLGAYGARAGGACFAAGTPLLTPDGAKSVESFQVGDLVLSRHENDPKGPVEAKVVEEVFVRSALMWHVHVGGQVIRSTAEHPFYVEGSGWVACQELKIGDRLLAADGTTVQVEDLLDTGEWESAYNLRIADFHTYFVGCTETWGFAVWAHNACVGLPGADAAEGEALATRAKTLYKGLSEVERMSASIAVSKVKVDGQWVEVVTMNGGARSSAVAKIRAAVEADGSIFSQASGRGHAEMHLYNQFSGYEGFQAIGVSHYRGPCLDICRPFFQQQGFSNIFWNNTFVR